MQVMKVCMGAVPDDQALREIAMDDVKSCTTTSHQH